MTFTTPVKLILDTNVVLDWLVFNDPALQSLKDAVQKGQVLLYSHRDTLNELRRVLNYPALRLRAIRQSAVLAQYQSLTREADSPAEFSPQNLLTPPGFPLCRDADDQLFVALALHCKVEALISRDKRVLALRKRAAKFSLRIMDVAQLNAILTQTLGT